MSNVMRNAHEAHTEPLLESSYASLPPRFYTRVVPTPVAAPRVIKFNARLADELQLGLDPMDHERIAQLLSGNRMLPGGEPIAAVYAGHQFGHFVPQLGDGRAILLGEARLRSNALRDIQLKGAGRTPYSRGGDGRAALGPVLREYLVSEAMSALRIPTTRALAAVATGEPVFRERPLPGAVLTRIASSHVRIGTFQYFAARSDVQAVGTLADYVIDRHFPAVAGMPRRYLALLGEVARRQASLVAAWLNIGFIHGVMNTDNTSIAGETIDFGPCAFMDDYVANAVFSSIDQQGRYAFSRQPQIALWNLARFAETLLPLIDDDAARAATSATAMLEPFLEDCSAQWLAGARAKLGLATIDAADAGLVQRLFANMQRTSADFTQTFRDLAALAEGREEAAGTCLTSGDSQWREWIQEWRTRGSTELVAPAERAAAMRRVNPKYIPRNHRIEQMISAATDNEDFSLFEELHAALAHPFDEQPAFDHLAAAPKQEERVTATFCGT